MQHLIASLNLGNLKSRCFSSTTFLGAFWSDQRAERGESDTAEKPPKAPASLYSKHEAPVQLVLCIDTMGQVCPCVLDVVRAQFRGTHVRAS